jgi:dsRNA-specific ribonuclease
MCALWLHCNVLSCSSAAVATYAPAELSWRRAALVNNSHLGRAAAAAGLQQHLQARSTQLERAVRRFAAAQAAAAAGLLPDAAAAKNQADDDEEQQQQVLVNFLEEAAPDKHWSGSCRGIWQDVWAGPEKISTAAGGKVDGLGTGGARSSAQQADQAAGPQAAAAAGGDKLSRRKPVRAPKVVADLVESIIGAVFVDSMAGGTAQHAHAWQQVWQTVQRLLQLPRN